MRTNEGMKGHLDNFVVSRGIFINEIIPIDDKEPNKINVMYGDMCKGGMSVKIEVIDGVMNILPYGYDGETHEQFYYHFNCSDCGHVDIFRKKTVVRCPFCAGIMEMV